jgi:hypothetical protein
MSAPDRKALVRDDRFRAFRAFTGTGAEYRGTSEAGVAKRGFAGRYWFQGKGRSGETAGGRSLRQAALVSRLKRALGLVTGVR